MTRTKAELAAIARDGAECLRCGRNLEGIPASLHHRKLKGRKVPKIEWDLVENIATMCGTGTTGCHGWAHHNRSAAKTDGWIVASWDIPHREPMHDLRNNMITLMQDGTKIIDPIAGINEGDPPF